MHANTHNDCTSCSDCETNRRIRESSQNARSLIRYEAFRKKKKRKEEKKLIEKDKSTIPPMKGPKKQPIPLNKFRMPIALENLSIPTISFRYGVVKQFVPA